MIWTYVKVVLLRNLKKVCTFKMFKALSDQNINILVISTSEIKISVLIDENQTQKAVVAIHAAFDLD